MATRTVLRDWPHIDQLPWVPRVDVYDQDRYLVVKAELPGVRKEDVHVDLEDDELIIHGERLEELEVPEENVHRRERVIGRFYRRIPLPFEPIPREVEARIEDGLLEVRIPWPSAQAHGTRRIPVQ